MVFRYARHTANIVAITAFYQNILGLEVLGSFEDHNGYDGIFLGKPDFAWHLEFTQSEEAPKHSFDDDDVMVFYPESKEEFDTILNKIQEASIKTVSPKNPYWISNGIQILDPDGYGVIICNQKIK